MVVRGAYDLSASTKCSRHPPGHFVEADLQAFDQGRLGSLYRGEDAAVTKNAILNVSERGALPSEFEVF